MTSPQGRPNSTNHALTRLDPRCRAAEHQPACRFGVGHCGCRVQDSQEGLSRPDLDEQIPSSSTGLSGVVGILYSLSYLESRDPDQAVEVLKGTLTAICESRADPHVAQPLCPRARWQALARHVHITAEALEEAHNKEPRPPPDFRTKLSALQQETIALRLGDVPAHRCAQLLGISPERLSTEMTSGLAILDRGLLSRLSLRRKDLIPGN